MQSTKTKNVSLISRMKKVNLPLVLMLIPGIVVLVIFSYIPMAGIVVAFKSIDYSTSIWSAPWCGLSNFKFLFETPDAWIITRNTLLYNLVFIFLGTIVNIVVAVLLNEICTKRLSKVYQNVLFLPHLFSIVIIAYLVFGFLSTNYGYLNRHIMPLLGLKNVDWYTDATKWPFLIVFINMWKSTGYGSILYIASMAGIDQSLYEAAEIDGATRWKKTLYVTVPSLTPIIIINVILALGKIFHSDFGLFYTVTMDSPALYPVTNIIDTYIYRSMLVTGDTGMSAAGAFYQSVMGLITILTANFVVKKIDEEKAFF